MKLVIAFIVLTLFNQANAYEMVGMISYNMGQVTPKPALYKDTSSGIGYTFLGRLDLGPGQLESGFQFIPTSISTQQSFGELRALGSYWLLPVMYRYTFLPPFFSLAAGFDYAVVGSSSLSLSGTQVAGITDGYRGHWGLQASLEANQDLGEDMSAVLDLRYRAGLGNAISFGNQASKYNFWIIAVGIQKHLE